MRKLFNKYHRYLDFDINKPKSLIIEYISQQKKGKKSFYDRFIGIPFDFSEVTLKGEDTMEITLQSTTFKPFKGNGKIVITLTTRMDRIGTQMKAEIIPYLEGNIYGICFLIFFLTFLSTIGLLVSTSWYMVAVLLSFWVIFMLVLHVTIAWSRSQLRENLENFVNDLKREAAANQV